ncbi:hypothetical protein ACILDT_09695 [Capnocytophaga canis]|uniref:Uncharacterized protein n=1 Tax=Capnocytophaga canis TaxID=1848903 RepID=A0A3A1YFP1_9FLAO|nr:MULTISPECIES: hypothetical protein [Capnocytophaga]ATA74691.1 hypothetical protein CGC52_04115 [Capnocytophaga sp. H2931]RIY36371.1 hypothetical protein CKY20_07775 [Capnocytophaga canis]
MERIYKSCKYYKKEKQNPFIDSDKLKARFWEGEKIFCEECEVNEKYYNIMLKELNLSIRKGNVTGKLLSPSMPIEEKVILFFIDLWNGKWFPYEIDVILKY